jgi:hypothetical protein
MKTGYCLITIWLLVAPVLAQPDRSKLEASIPPAQLEELVSSRRRAQEELRPAGADDISPWILTWFMEPGASVAVVKMEQVIADGGDHFTVDLVVEKTLRGAHPPAKISVKVHWTKQPCRFISSCERIRPLTGKRALGGLIVLDDLAQSKFWSFAGILDLDDPKDAAFLPSATAAAKMDADAAISGYSVYEAELTSEDPVIHELAMKRLLDAKDCPAESRCEQSILSEVRTLLASPNPSHRMEAVRWLGELSQKIQPSPVNPCGSPGFHREPVRRLLKLAVQDKNVAVGDSAFEHLAKLEFRGKGNAGYCEEIVPALRTVEKYPFTRDDHRIVGGPLSGSSICVGPAQE